MLAIGSVTTTTSLTSLTGLTSPTSVVEAARFKPCFETGIECAGVLVPRDYRSTTTERIELFVSRKRARKPELRIGTLFVNPGGPGSPALDLVRNAKDVLTTEVLNRFDIIGVDPRGTERSAPLRCEARPRPVPQRALDETPREAREYRAITAAFAQQCGDGEGDRLSYMDTETAARDMDVVRVAIGEDTISYLGFSYGTYLGAVYGSLFPANLRIAVLDSAIDPQRFGAPFVPDRFAAAEIALDAFLTACSDGRLQPCAFNDGTDLRAKYNALRNRELRKSEAATAMLDNNVYDLVGQPRNGWPVLGRALHELLESGTPNYRPVATDNQAAQTPSTDSDITGEDLDAFSGETNSAIFCRDGFVPRDIAGYLASRNAVRDIAPRFSEVTDLQYLALNCVDWPTPLAPTVTLRQGLPVVIVANTFDLTTPFSWSQGLALALGAPMIVREGGGHIAADKSSCVRAHIADALLNASRSLSATCAELTWTR